MRSEEVGRSLALFLLSFAMVLSIVFVIIGAQRTNAGSSDPPTGIHLTWNEDDTAHTIVVTWITSKDNAGDNIKYGINSGNYTYSAAGSHHTYSGAEEWIHDVELTGLSPNKVYYFVCGGDNGGWSEERSFRTAPDNLISFRFIAGGDSRSGGGDWPAGRDSVSQAMAKFDPSFVLFSGDFVMQGNYQWEWDNWLAAEQMYWVDNNNLSIPIIPCPGNHEIYGDSGVSYFGQFSLPTFPADEKWYSFDWGPNLHITVLDTETAVAGDQTTWLQQDLAEHENYLWKVVLFHQPPYSDGPDGSNSSVKRYWVPLFDNYHVDLVISGHNHLYERTYPLENGAISDNVADNGTIYVVNGGWGAPLYTGSPSWFAAVGPISKHNFTVVDILDNGMLNVRAIDTDGNLLDEFSIQKTVPKPTILPGGIGVIAVVIGAVVVIIACVAAAFYLLKVRK